MRKASISRDKAGYRAWFHRSYHKLVSPPTENYPEMAKSSHQKGSQQGLPWPIIIIKHRLFNFGDHEGFSVKSNTGTDFHI